MQMTAVYTVSFHLSECSVGIGTFPIGGCRSVIGPVPQLLWMKGIWLLRLIIARMAGIVNGKSLLRPVAIGKDRHRRAVGPGPGDGQVRRTDHEVDVDHGVVQAGCGDSVFVHIGTASQAGRVRCAQGQVARGVFVEERFIEEDARQGNGRVIGDEGYFAEAAGAVVDGDEFLQDVFARFGGSVDDFAVFEGQVEFVDEVAVIDQGLGAVDRAVDRICLGGRIDFFRRDVGIEQQVVRRFFHAALPDMTGRQADSQVRSQAVRIVQAGEMLVRHPGPALLQFAQMGVPIGQGIGTVGTGRLEDLLPQGFVGGGFVEVRIE